MKLTAESGLTIEIDLLRLCRVEELCHTRDWRLTAFGKLVAARLRVLLAFGEKNNAWQITQSVICFDEREQSLSTIVRDIGRALKQTFEKVISSTAISTKPEIIFIT